MKRRGFRLLAAGAVCLLLGALAALSALRQPPQGTAPGGDGIPPTAGLPPTGIPSSPPAVTGGRMTRSDVARAVLRSLTRRLSGRPRGCQVIGFVWTWSPDPFEQMMAALEKASSAEEALQALPAKPDVEPAAHAVVTLRNGSRTWQARSNVRGQFIVSGLPAGTYEIEAEHEGQGAGPAQHGFRRVDVQGYMGLNLQVRADAITVRGRICDEAGLPVAGAIVSGEMATAADDPRRETDWVPDAVSAVSDAEGDFELHGLAPADVRSVLAYLQGSGPAGERVGLTATITVTADGFEDASLVLPLITEEVLGRARRFAEAMARFGADPDVGRLPERPEVPLAASRGNTIADVDFVLSGAGE